MTLERQISEWNGKSADDIAKIYEQHSSDPDLITNLIDLLESDALQKGATWLIKHGLEDGKTLTLNQEDQIIRSLNNLTHWESQLHVLQIFDSLTIRDEHLASVEPFLRNCLKSQKKFVRAWGYSGFHSLAKQHPQYAEEVDLMLMDAMVNESGSVRARIRNLNK